MTRVPYYSDEFKRYAVTLVAEVGMSPREVAQKLGCSDASVSRWLRQADTEAGSDPVTGSTGFRGAGDRAASDAGDTGVAPSATGDADSDPDGPWWAVGPTAATPRGVPRPPARERPFDAGPVQDGAAAPDEASERAMGSEGAQPPVGSGESRVGPSPEWAAVPPPPSARDFSEERMLRPSVTKPQSGWRKAVYAVSGGAINPGLSTAEHHRRDRIGRVKAPIRGCRKIAVISRKGGVGKTTTTLMLGHTLAQWRGDRVVALDGNPDAGSLGYRVRRETSSSVTDLLGDVLLERYADVRAHTSQAPSRLEVVASDDDPRVTEAMGEKEYRQAVLQLERHYNLILLDTGTGILDSATQGILRVADQVVLVLAPSLDGARAASLTLDWLDEHGYQDLVRGSVAVLNECDDKGPVEVDRVEEHFAQRCQATQRVPWDRHLNAGAECHLTELSDDAKQAYLELAAKVADGFAEPG